VEELKLEREGSMFENLFSNLFEFVKKYVEKCEGSRCVVTFQEIKQNVVV